VPIGRLIRYTEKGWGFLKSDDSGSAEETFVHRSILRAAGVSNPKPGMAFAYEVGERDGKACAVSVESLRSWQVEPTVDEDGWPSHLDLPTGRKAPTRDNSKNEDE
jgi:cold shock CspA family protein